MSSTTQLLARRGVAAVFPDSGSLADGYIAVAPRATRPTSPEERLQPGEIAEVTAVLEQTYVEEDFDDVFTFID